MIMVGALLVSAASISFSIAQPTTSPTEVWVDDNYAGLTDGTPVDGHIFGTDATDTISNGSGMVAPYGTVHVAPGTYNENVVIDTPLVLRGANAGIPANGTRGGESIINGSGSIGIAVTTNDVTIDGFSIIDFSNAVNATGDNTMIVNNLLSSDSAFIPINGTGNNSIITDNNIYLNTGLDAIVWYGNEGTISRNYITALPSTITAAEIPSGIVIFGQGNGLVMADNHVEFPGGAYIGVQAIGNDARITGNNLNISYVFGLIGVTGDRASVSGNVLKAMDVVEAISVSGKDGAVADNTLSASYSEGFIYYFGDAGAVQRNQDLSVNESEWPLVVYQASLFGHGVITDNTGGYIIYMGEMLGLAPWGTISNNHVNSSTLGIAAIGDYNVIDHNEINAMVGTYTLGTKVLIESNDYNAMSSFTYGPIPLSAGAVFDGDMCTVTDNTFDNFSVAIANVGLFKVIGLTPYGAVASQDADKVNATLESTAADIAALQAFAESCIGKYEPVGTDVSATALSSLGYRGYGNSITGNTLNYDEAPCIVGIATLGYDFVVDSNTFNCVNDSTVLAGMIVGGDGGKVTNNYLSNVSLLGMYYGGLLKFENGLYTSDLLGMDAQISGNTVDNRGSGSSGLFPWGIIFTGYNGAIENNDLMSCGLGILTVQFEGSIVKNTIDAFSGDYIIPLSAGGMSAMALEGAGASGLGGIISVCNNLTVTGNLVNGTLMGLLFVPIDPYTTWGTAYIADNTLTNNAIQLAVVPAYFKARLGDGTVSTIDNATLQRIMSENTLDRKIYITDNTSELWALNIVDLGYFNVDAIAVYGSLNVASLASILVDGDGYTVRVSPGTYSLFIPVIVARSNLTYLGDPANPGNVIVDASSLSLLDSAFEVWADDANITGFTITGTPEDCGIAVGRLGSLLGVNDVGAQDLLDDIEDDLMDLQVSNANISNNTISNFAAGIVLDNCTYTEITYNSLTGNGAGVYLTNKSLSNSTEIHYNDIAGNLYFGVNYNDTIAVPDPEEDLWVHAENNWWGSSTGPRDVTADPASTGTGDSITYYVLYEPWMTKPVLTSQYTYHLVEGWNLIGIPLDVSDYTIEGFFPADVRDNMLTLWTWDESAQEYNFYGTDPNDWYYTQYPTLTGMETGKGYWVEMKPGTDMYFTIDGYVPDYAPASSVELVNGWNLVSTTGTGPQSVDVMYPDAFTVWTWNSATQEYNFYGSDPNDWYYTQYPALTTLQPGDGEWVEITAV